MQQYNDEQLIIIGRYHALREARDQCMSEINRNYLSMSGTDLTSNGEAARMLELLEALTGLVKGFQNLESEYELTRQAYRNMSEQVQDNG